AGVGSATQLSPALLVRWSDKRRAGRCLARGVARFSLASAGWPEGVDNRLPPIGCPESGRPRASGPYGVPADSGNQARQKGNAHQCRRDLLLQSRVFESRGQRIECAQKGLRQPRKGFAARELQHRRPAADGTGGFRFGCADNCFGFGRRSGCDSLRDVTYERVSVGVLDAGCASVPLRWGLGSVERLVGRLDLRIGLWVWVG